MNITDIILKWSSGFGDHFDQWFAKDATFGLTEYYAIGPRGAADNEGKLFIFKMTFDSTGFVTNMKMAPPNSRWDLRATYF